jgi:hypothetical protein
MAIGSDRPLVTVCIPAWQAADFIDATLGFARGQTHGSLRILVSIDASSDRTEELCRRHAREDPRVEVMAHRTRIGWAANINSLLDAVESEYFFIYPHDDVIDARYVEVLLQRLAGVPEAASAQCNVLAVDPQGRQYISPGSSHEGPAHERIIASLVGHAVGEPLRSLTRTAYAADVRFPQTSRIGFEAHVAYQARLFAAGPTLHVPEVLYWRLGRRRGGMTESWKRFSIDELLADQRTNAEDCLHLIERQSVSPAQREMMVFALHVNLMQAIRRYESASRAPTLVDPRSVCASFAYEGIPPGIAVLPPALRRSVRRAYAYLVRAETVHHLRRRAIRPAARRMSSLGVRSGATVAAHRVWRRMRRRPRPVVLPPEVRARLQQ